MNGNQKLSDDQMDAIVSQINDIDDMFSVLWRLERKFEFIGSVVTRGDVESEFGDMWEFEGTERREMTQEQWDKFRQEWFWRKGHSEVMWDGVIGAIRWDLREAGLAPGTAVID
jgi:hypothetical protein